MGVLAWLDLQVLRGWKVFVSLKFSIFLLALIGSAAIYGTMRFASNAALGDNAIPMARVHFFEGRWFIGLLVLFAVNLIFSTWRVTRMSFGIWGKREFRRGRVYYQHGNTPRGAVVVPGGIDEAERALRARYTRVHRDGDALFAHRGLLSRWGPTIVHIGILTVIFSQVAKAVLLWNGQLVTEGRFIAGEGEPATNFIHVPLELAQQLTDKNRREVPIPYWIRVLDFDEVKHPNSEMPAYFSSLIEIRDPATQAITVAQLDMNHSINVGGLQFHQAGFVPSPEGRGERINFDVRDATTGERIAVTDTVADNRVRVGDSDLFLEVDGIQPADRWRLYRMDDPHRVHAEGLLSGGQQLNYAFRIEKVYPDFRIDPEKQEPVNASNDANNPALQVAVLLDGRKVADAWLFLDPRLAEVVPDTHPRFRLHFEDVRARRGVDMAAIDWSNPEQVVYLIRLEDRQGGATAGEELLGVGESSRAYPYTTRLDHDDQVLGTEGRYEVSIMGPTQRYATILSVVHDPTVEWSKLGVVIMVLGAMMTFVFRYRALYAWWDDKAGVLRMALVPRWGQSPVQQEFDALVATLSHGKGLAETAAPPETTLDEVAPAHRTTQVEVVES